MKWDLIWTLVTAAVIIFVAYALFSLVMVGAAWLLVRLRAGK